MNKQEFADWEFFPPIFLKNLPSFFEFEFQFKFSASNECWFQLNVAQFQIFNQWENDYLNSNSHSVVLTSKKMIIQLAGLSIVKIKSYLGSNFVLPSARSFYICNRTVGSVLPWTMFIVLTQGIMTLENANWALFKQH